VPPSIYLASAVFRPWSRGGSRSPSAGGLRPQGFRVKVWWGRRSSGGGVLYNKVFSALALSRWRRRETCGSGVVLGDFLWLWDHQIIKKLHRRLFLLLRLGNRSGLLDLFGNFPSATNNVREKRQRWHAIDMVWRLTKDI
jgi:hypothetical protein